MTWSRFPSGLWLWLVNESNHTDAAYASVARDQVKQQYAKKGNSRTSSTWLEWKEHSIDTNPSWNDDSIIQCSVSIERLRGNHVALSYVWGIDEPSHQIEINGRPFFVRQNLFDFCSTHGRHCHYRTCGSMPFLLTREISRKRIIKSGTWQRSTTCRHMWSRG